jgi:hypothetical protein
VLWQMKKTHTKKQLDDDTVYIYIGIYLHSIQQVKSGRLVTMLKTVHVGDRVWVPHDEHAWVCILRHALHIY